MTLVIKIVLAYRELSKRKQGIEEKHEEENTSPWEYTTAGLG